VLSYLVKRILLVPPTLLVIALVCFALVALYPGDFYTGHMIAAAIHGEDPFEFHAQMLALRGLDKPWIVQFAYWVEGAIAHGDLGYSFISGRPVTDYVFAKDGTIGWSLIILSTSIFLAFAFGVPIGVVSAVCYRRPLDHAVTATTFIFASMPPQLLALLFLFGYSRLINPNVRSGLMWGACHYSLVSSPLTWSKALSHAAHLIPVWVIVSAPVFALVVRTLRLQLLDTFSELYMETARGKGLRERRVLFRHALPNVIGTLISQWAQIQSLAIVGLFLVGEILAIPSIGGLLMNAIRRQDQPLLNGVLMLFAFIVVVGNLFGDVLLALIDPRIRYD
jgi:peptide/nickel transport system permease protein